jgi:hypothetical protein
VYSCNQIQENKNISEILNKKENISENDIEKIIECDSIYGNKDFEVVFRKYIEYTQIDNKGNNSVFIFQKHTPNGIKEIMRDSIESDFGGILFKDFNNDGVKDILVENISDVRSNLTYYLYLFDLQSEKLTKIKNFNIIKNPNYLEQYDLIDNKVMSGRNWTAFYKISGDSIISFEDDDYVVYWGQDENENPINPEEDYRLKLEKVINRVE